MATKVYDSKSVDLIVCDIPITDGLGDPFVEITPVGDSFEDDAGVDGEVCRYATHEERVDVTVTLKGSSSHNEQFSALVAADRASIGGAGIGVFLVKDGSGATIVVSDRCWCTAPAPKAFGKTLPDTVWKFRMVAPPLGHIVGGN